MQAAEHILLESDEREVPELRSARKVHSQLRIRSGLRRSAIELTLMDYYFLSVRSSRPRRATSQYVLDLRFVDPAVRFSRHIAWRCVGASALLTTMAIAVAWRISSSPVRWWQNDWLPVCLTLFCLAIGAGLVAAWRTTETLTFWSLNGHARLLEFTGGVGTLQAATHFRNYLVAHLRLASAARRRSRDKHLRDEMREHSRLRDAGVLSDEQYEDSKRRILAQHAPATPPKAASTRAAAKAPSPGSGAARPAALSPQRPPLRAAAASAGRR